MTLKLDEDVLREVSGLFGVVIVRVSIWAEILSG
jgi:hypothetical protein